MTDAAEAKPPSIRMLNKAVDDADAIVARLKNELAEHDRVIAEIEAKSLALSDAAIASEAGPKAYDTWVQVEKQAEDLRRERKFKARKLEKAEADAAEAARVRREREYLARIERNEGFFGLTDPKPGTLIGELDLLETKLGEVIGHFRNAIRISQQKIAPSFVGNLPPSGLGINVGEIIQAIEHEIFRQGHDPFLGGTPGGRQQASFPGGRCPDLRLLGLPGTVRSISGAYRVYGQFNSDIQRGKRRWDGRDPADFTPEKITQRARSREAILTTGIDAETLRPLAMLPATPTEPAAFPDPEAFPAAALPDPENVDSDGLPIETVAAASDSFEFTDPVTGRTVQSSVPDRPMTAEERIAREKASLANSKKMSAADAAAAISVTAGRRRTRIG